MNLVTATLIAGFLLLSVGALLLSYPAPIRKGLLAFPRSKGASLILLAVATGLVLWQVSQLGEADFGKYKNILFVFFLILAVGSWFKVPDFLGTRALTVLGLLLAGQFLDAAYLEQPTTRLFLVVFSYIIIVLCLYLASVPYRLRDAINALDQRLGARKILGISLACYGAVLCLVPFTFAA